MAQISVILPTFNRIHTLKRCIGSVINQIDADFELLIVDDGSDDGSEQLLKEYNQDARVKIFYQSNHGVSSARNLGVSEAQADFIAFIDSDDEWLPGKLKSQWQFSQDTDYRIFQTTEQWIRNGIRVNPPKHLVKVQGDIFQASLERCMITPSSVFLEKKLFEESGGFKNNFPVCEDYDLWLRISCKEKVGLINKDYLIRYGGHEDQLSNTFGMDEWRIRSMFELFKQNFCNETQKIQLLTCLKSKLDIYRQGCKKRNNSEKVSWCEGIAEQCGI